MGKTILCVDDDVQIRELIQTFLEGKGYKVITSTDGWDCLREIVVKKPDLILMDINMPKLDGLNTLDMIKVTRLTHQVPIILVSGEADRDTIMKAAKLGADDFLVKPFSFEELAARVAAQLFTLDYARLKNILQKLHAPAPGDAHSLGIDHIKYKDWDSYPALVEDMELCVLLPKGLGLEKAAKFDELKAHQHIIVLAKAKSHWKCVWPHGESGAAKKAA
jgi:CheY-like chemotaxis protein